MKTLFFLKVKCAENRETFYVRHDLAADDRWVLTYGVKTLPPGESSFGENMQFNYGSIRLGPQYKCPHCGNRSFFRCGACGNYTCHDKAKKTAICAHCGNDDPIEGSIESVESCNNGIGQ